MAIRPKFADLILGGQKTYELRRSRPGFGSGSTVWIYATKPCGAVIGAFEAGEVVSASAGGLWSTLGARLGVSPTELEQYLEGAALGYAIEVRRAHRLPVPVPLPAGAVVPQSYRYLKRGVAADDQLIILLNRAGNPFAVRIRRWLATAKTRVWRLRPGWEGAR
jgi:predicted transcriptional regulator